MCKVCSSPSRLVIEQEIANGRTYVGIIKSLPEGHDLHPRNLKDHYGNGHMPLEVETLRTIIDQRARIRGKSIEDSNEALVDHVSLAQTVVQKTFEGIAAGELRPSIKDGIRAAALLHAVGLTEDGSDQQDVVQAFVAYMEETRRLMPPEMWDQFGRNLAANSDLKALKAKAAGALESKIVDVDPA
jgi:hypothetical protein